MGIHLIPSMSKEIILYDDKCRLCINLKSSIERKGGKDSFQFVAIDSRVGVDYMKSLSLTKKEQNSLILIDEENNYSTKTNAVISIIKRLRKYRILYFVLRILPLSIRDLGYDIIARIRHWF